MSDQTILIELDALLDTRLGAVSQISPEACATLMLGDYWTRTTDDFGLQSKGQVSTEAYQAAYRARGESLRVLQASALTNMVQLLGPLTRTLQSRATRKLDVGKITITINVWPYPLEPYEREAIAQALAPYVALSTHIETLSLPPEELTPTYLVDQYDLYIVYNYDQWDQAQRTNLLAKPIPEFTMMIPQLLRKDPSKEDLTLEDGHEVDPFKVYELILLQYLAIEVQPVFFYCMIKP